MCLTGRLFVAPRAAWSQHFDAISAKGKNVVIQVVDLDSRSSASAQRASEDALADPSPERRGKVLSIRAEAEPLQVNFSQVKFLDPGQFPRIFCEMQFGFRVF